MKPVVDHSLAEQLSQSQIVHDYEKAFAEATGLTLKFEPGKRKRAMLRGQGLILNGSAWEPGGSLCR